jgi:hypothetical protein
MAIRLPVISEYSPKGIKKMQADLAQLSTKSAKAGYVMKKAFVPATAALGAMAVAGLKFAKAAAADQVAAGKLAGTLRNTTNATEDQIAANEEWISSTSMAVAVADDELRPALANLARVTGDVAGAQDALSIALDVSAATGADLQTVSKTLAKAMSGNTTALKKLDPQLGNLIEKGASSEEILKTLEDRFGGAAEAAANSADGGFKKMEIAIGEAQESIGTLLLPILEKVIPKLESVANWAKDNPGAFKVIAGVIAGLATAIVAVNVAMKVYNAVAAVSAAVTWALNAALWANPITWVVAGIIALIAVLTLAYFKFEGFRNFIDGLWDKIVAGAGFAVEIIKGYFETLIGFWKRVFNGFATAWNATLGGIGFTAPSWLKYIGLGAIAGKEFRIPEIPQLANGGIVTRPTLAMIGEAGPEAVVPLNRSQGFGDVNITIQGALDPVAVGRQIRQILANDLSRYGRA